MARSNETSEKEIGYALLSMLADCKWNGLHCKGCMREGTTVACLQDNLLIVVKGIAAYLYQARELRYTILPVWMNEEILIALKGKYDLRTIRNTAQILGEL